MQAFPHLVVARRSHDFRTVYTSPSFPRNDALKEEARWFALDWWGNCFVEDFRGAIGHVRSMKDRNYYLVMLVQPGPVAPDRFVVCLENSEYSGFGFSPFAAVSAGLFDFTQEFYTDRNEGQYHRDWKKEQIGITTEPVDGYQKGFRVGKRHLHQGHSIIVPSMADGVELRRELELFSAQLMPEILQNIGMCTFTNAVREKLNHFGPMLAGWYNLNRTETLKSVLNDLVDIDEQGSPFKTIRREGA
jgi:hypothetical protein